jgi:hypothetical protein
MYLTCHLMSLNVFDLSFDVFEWTLHSKWITPLGHDLCQDISGPGYLLRGIGACYYRKPRAVELVIRSVEQAQSLYCDSVTHSVRKGNCNASWVVYQWPRLWKSRWLCFHGLAQVKMISAFPSIQSPIWLRALHDKNTYCADVVSRGSLEIGSECCVTYHFASWACWCS